MKNPTASATDLETIEFNPGDLAHPGLYFNRELSWLQFNERVLQEALSGETPLLERVKFLSIFSGNLDEFFMIRVSGLRRQLAGGALETPPDGMTPAEQLASIRDRVTPALELGASCWANDLKPELGEAGVRILSYDELKKKQKKLLRRHFKREIFPVLTPLALDPSHPFPHISSLCINLAVVVHDPVCGERFARVKVPHVLDRLLRIPNEDKADDSIHLGLLASDATNFVWLEEVVAANLDLLSPGLEIVDVHAFRVTRDADIEIEDDEASDLLAAIEEVVEQRHFGSIVRLEIVSKMPPHIREVLMRHLGLAPFQVYEADGPLGLADLMELSQLDLPQLRDTRFLPHISPALMTEESIFSILRRQDLLFYHPYDSFSPIVDFVRAAAHDPDVVAIKQTLYRVGPNSPIVEALQEARENGKQVSAVVELKARFDEQNNIVWARALERAGVHVVYGVMGLKTHAKICLVVRRESRRVARYVHLGTGNYNPVTSRVYTDLGLLTRDPDIGKDASDLFNSLTGYSNKETYRKLLVSPGSIRREIIHRIDREISIHEKTGDGYLAFKMNSLVDRLCIQALYRASQAGVRIDLQVRGICCLRPGLPGISETIRVSSIVGRFLEHSRLYYFGNGGDEELLAGSADMMPRNLDRRVEVLFPISDPKLRAAVRENILSLHLNDNVQSCALLPTGEYAPLGAATDEIRIDSQKILLREPGSWSLEE